MSDARTKRCIAVSSYIAFKRVTVSSSLTALCLHNSQQCQSVVSAIRSFCPQQSTAPICYTDSPPLLYNQSRKSICLTRFQLLSTAINKVNLPSLLLAAPAHSINLWFSSLAPLACRLSWKACPSQTPKRHRPPCPQWSTPPTPQLMDPSLL